MTRDWPGLFASCAFLSKRGIIVTRHAPERHLIWRDDRFFIDVTTLHRDFKSRYFDRAGSRVIASGASGLQSLQGRYNLPEVRIAIDALKKHARPRVSGFTSQHCNQSTTAANSPTIPPTY